MCGEASRDSEGGWVRHETVKMGQEKGGSRGPDKHERRSMRGVEEVVVEVQAEATGAIQRPSSSSPPRKLTHRRQRGRSKLGQ